MPTPYKYELHHLSKLKMSFLIDVTHQMVLKYFGVQPKSSRERFNNLADGINPVQYNPGITETVCMNKFLFSFFFFFGKSMKNTIPGSLWQQTQIA